MENNSVDIAVFLFAKTWVKKQMRPFTSDDLRDAYTAHAKLPKNTHLPFGGVLAKLHQIDAIKDNGSTVKSTRKEAKSRKITVWISKEYSAAQQARRLSEETKHERELLAQQLDIFTTNPK